MLAWHQGSFRLWLAASRANDKLTRRAYDADIVLIAKTEDVEVTTVIDFAQISFAPYNVARQIAVEYAILLHTARLYYAAL